MGEREGRGEREEEEEEIERERVRQILTRKDVWRITWWENDIVR